MANEAWKFVALCDIYWRRGGVRWACGVRYRNEDLPTLD